MPRMTKQLLFSQAYLGLQAQEWKRAVAEDGTCCYRTPEGLKCAIGHSIPDDKYFPSLERMSLCNILRSCKIHTKLLDFAIRLQKIHDLAADSNFKVSLEIFADKEGLFIPFEPRP